MISGLNLQNLNVNSLMSTAASMSTGSLATSAQLGTASSVSDLLASVSSTTGSSASAIGGSDANAYMDYLNGSYSKMMSADSADSSSFNGNMMDYVGSDGLDANAFRSNYLKQWFPGMSDEQISSLNAYYDKAFASMGDAMGIDMSSLTGTSGSDSVSSSSSSYSSRNKNKGVDGLMSDAESMVGMTETGDTSAINQVTGESGINCATTPWCAAWAMNMLNDHGVLDTSSCSNVNYCPTIKNWAKDQGIYKANGSGYVPQAGDAILFDWNGDGTAQHIGIVQKVENGKVYTIEGNSSDSVKKNSYSLSSGSVMGYVACAEQK